MIRLDNLTQTDTVGVLSVTTEVGAEPVGVCRPVTLGYPSHNVVSGVGRNIV
jgi:hypothetical protein